MQLRRPAMIAAIAATVLTGCGIADGQTETPQVVASATSTHQVKLAPTKVAPRSTATATPSPASPRTETALAESATPNLTNEAGRASICADVEEFRTAFGEFMDEPMTTAEAVAAKTDQATEFLNSGDITDADYKQLVAVMRTC